MRFVGLQMPCKTSNSMLKQTDHCSKTGLLVLVLPYKGFAAKIHVLAA